MASATLIKSQPSNLSSSSTPVKSKPSNPATAIYEWIDTPEKLNPATAIYKLIDTPEKPSQPRVLREVTDLVQKEVPLPPQDGSPIELPEKYKILSELFNSVESSIRLIMMKRKSTIFPAICSSIQYLTDRKFTYKHLAQMKYIMPDALVVKKVLLRDEVTCCMKPELHISLQVDAIENNEKTVGECRYSVLRKLFRERLTTFYEKHPEEDVPECGLPHPFSQEKTSMLLHSYSPSGQVPSDNSPQGQFVFHSLLPASFKKLYSQRVPVPESQRTSLTCYSLTLPEDHLDSVSSSSVKCIMKPPPPPNIEPFIGDDVSLPSFGLLTNQEEVKKSMTTPARLMAPTHELQTIKRSRSTSDIDSLHMDFSTPKSKSPMMKRSAMTQFFATPTKPGTKENEVRKEWEASENHDVTKANRRQELLPGLPNIFDMIFLMFHSSNRSVMTKEEVIFKIVANSTKSTGEVEEQLWLLQELVPEWISVKATFCLGDLCCVNKISSPEEIRQKIVEAECVVLSTRMKSTHL